MSNPQIHNEEHVSAMLADLHRQHGDHVPVYAKLRLLWWSIPLWVHRWIWIDEEENEDETLWNVWLSTHKDSHNIMSGPCYCVTVRKTDGAIMSAYESAVSMWEIHGAKGVRRAAERVFAMVRRAHADLVTETGDP